MTITVLDYFDDPYAADGGFAAPANVGTFVPVNAEKAKIDGPLLAVADDHGFKVSAPALVTIFATILGGIDTSEQQPANYPLLVSLSDNEPDGAWAGGDPAHFAEIQQYGSGGGDNDYMTWQIGATWKLDTDAKVRVFVQTNRPAATNLGMRLQVNAIPLSVSL